MSPRKKLQILTTWLSDRRTCLTKESHLSKRCLETSFWFIAIRAPSKALGQQSSSPPVTLLEPRRWVSSWGSVWLHSCTSLLQPKHQLRKPTATLRSSITAVRAKATKKRQKIKKLDAEGVDLYGIEEKLSLNPQAVFGVVPWICLEKTRWSHI